VKEELTKLRQSGCGGLEVLTREGSPEELDGMLRVSAGTARRVIITQVDEEDCEDPNAQLRRASGLMLSLQQNAQPLKERRGAVVVSTPSDFVNGLAAKEAASMGSYAEVTPSSFVSRLLAQCTVQHGLSHVFEELLLQGAGNEIYISEPVSAYKQLQGKGFGELAAFFPSACVLGVVEAPAEGAQEGQVLLSPPSERVLEKSDRLVVLADAKKGARPSARPVRAAEEPVASKKATSSYRAPQNLVLLNWNPKMEEIVEQIDEVAAPGSTLTVLSPECPDELQSNSLANLKLNHVKGDPSEPADLAKLALAQADSVVILQRGAGGEADDSHSLLCIHAVQQVLADVGKSLLDPSSPKLIGELSSPEMEQLICEQWPGAAGDFVLPRELASGTLVQFALQPELATVFLELLSARGKEIGFASAQVYAEAEEELTFGELCTRARAKGEVAIGFQRAGESLPELNPGQGLKLTVQPGDQLIVLGEIF